MSGDIVDRSRPARARDLPDDGPSPEDIERFGDVTRTCPSCGKEVFDDVSVCYHCGAAVEEKPDGAVSGRRLVIVVMLILAMLGLGGAAVRWLF